MRKRPEQGRSGLFRFARDRDCPAIEQRSSFVLRMAAIARQRTVIASPADGMCVATGPDGRGDSVGRKAVQS
jgi:hypothetical protein